MGISQVNISLFIIVAFLGDRGGGLANCRPRRPPSFPLVTREELVAGLGQPVFPPSATLPAVVEEVLWLMPVVPLLENVIAVSSENTVKYGTV